MYIHGTITCVFQWWKKYLAGEKEKEEKEEKEQKEEK